jgi:catechol 2,3-dioxygenase-like lactoylglutathione lyase family enzyme
MLDALDWLALEVRSLDRAGRFYGDRLDLPLSSRTETERRYSVGETTLVVRRPTAVPRGGLHTHFAMATGARGYGRWLDDLADFGPAEFDFGVYRSLYVDDPDGHCVEIGGADADEAETGLTGVFEVVLEVASLDAAERAYRALGFEVVDRGDERRRVRLRGPMDLELWEPQLGIGNARGGVHVDLGFLTDDPGAAATAIGEHVVHRERVDDGVRIRDADGHYVTFGSA